MHPFPEFPVLPHASQMSRRTLLSPPLHVDEQFGLLAAADGTVVATAITGTAQAIALVTVRRLTELGSALSIGLMAHKTFSWLSLAPHMQASIPSPWHDHC